MANCPRLISDYSVPQVKWYQTDCTVVVRIQLNDISDYYLRVDGEYLIFSTTKDGKKYCLVLHLFGAVIAEKTRNVNIGREVRVHLIKALKCFPWLRLIISKEKELPISSDFDYIHETDPSDIYSKSEGEKMSFQEIDHFNKMRALQKSTEECNHKRHILYDDFSSDSDEDELHLFDVF